ncbi:hypothetical protein GPNCGGLF_LOCUS575 [Methylorubrum aminovorans]
MVAGADIEYERSTYTMARSTPEGTASGVMCGWYFPPAGIPPAAGWS